MSFCIVLDYMFVDVYANYIVMMHTTESKRHLSYFHYQVNSMPEAVGLYMLISSTVLMV